MSIRNYLPVMLPLMFPVIIFSARSDKAWEKYKKEHDLFLLIKNTHKNEDRVVKFHLKNLPDDVQQVTWIEREDLLPEAEKIDQKVFQDAACQCNKHATKVGAGDDKVVMLTIGLPHPSTVQYMFVMEPYYQCVAAFVVSREITLPKPTAQEKAQEYLGKFGHALGSLWHSITGSGKKS